ncbi:MAG: hypothetical protein WC091_02750 [Sulfuricellaceae bacterium]
MGLSRIRKWGLAVGFVAALTFCGAVYSAESRYSCLPLASLLNMLIKDQFAMTAIGDVPHRGASIELVINQKTGDWVIFGIDADLNACVILEGTNWRFIGVRKA